MECVHEIPVFCYSTRSQTHTHTHTHTHVTKLFRTPDVTEIKQARMPKIATGMFAYFGHLGLLNNRNLPAPLAINCKAISVNIDFKSVRSIVATHDSGKRALGCCIS